MSDRDEETPAAIARHLGPNGLPRGYKGEEALPLKRRR